MVIRAAHMTDVPRIRREVNDAALIAALLEGEGVNRVYFERGRLRDAVKHLYTCRALGERCVALVGLGYKPTHDPERFTALAKLIPIHVEHCIGFILDSDELEPGDALRRVASLLGCDATLSKDEWAAEAVCVFRRRGVEAHAYLLAWRCSAECWIAALTPDAPLTFPALLHCDSAIRRRCSSVASSMLGARSFEERPALLRGLLGGFGGYPQVAALRRRVVD